MPGPFGTDISPPQTCGSCLDKRIHAQVKSNGFEEPDFCLFFNLDVAVVRQLGDSLRFLTIRRRCAPIGVHVWRMRMFEITRVRKFKFPCQVLILPHSAELNGNCLISNLISRPEAWISKFFNKFAVIDLSAHPWLF